MSQYRAYFVPSGVDPTGMVCQGKQDCCVTEHMDIKIEGKLVGGGHLNDYVSRGDGFLFNNKEDGATLGPLLTRFRVQMIAPYSGKGNCGVMQTLTHENSNQAFLDHTAQYIKEIGIDIDVTNGLTLKEPALVLNPPAMIPRFKDGKMTFGDAPASLGGAKGDIIFETCFLSKGKTCSYTKCCTKWKWTIDTTGKFVKDIENKVTKVLSYCKWNPLSVTK